MNNGSFENRYRDWELMRFWFRGIEAFAPWVNRVFFVSNGQKPIWLNTDHPKLRMVTHQDYIPEIYLPTFNSNVIELWLHNIPDLSERFVLFNDDMFLTAPVTPEDFFEDGLPRGEYADVGVLTLVRRIEGTPFLKVELHFAGTVGLFPIEDTVFLHKTPDPLYAVELFSLVGNIHGPLGLRFPGNSFEEVFAVHL